jgi:tRNA-uridine 2-sulfurtransferase
MLRRFQSRMLISTNISSKKRVFVGLSGGVDSAVSATLLKKQGFEVTGVFIKVWQPDFLECSWRDERRDAMRVAARLDLPFLFFDFEEEYKKGVADYMIAEYRAGRTPNPDVMCNREVKFGAFWKKAKEMGADYIATGHYAKTDGVALKEGADKNKDQSYFLWTLTKDDLSHTLFPIGHLQKEEVRGLAKKFNLPVAEKRDSQGICFLGQVDLETFLKHYIEIKPGEVLDLNGKVIGRHRGALLYTLGERHGFEINQTKPNSKPFFIVGKDIGQNTVTVSDSPKAVEEHLPAQVEVKNINWISDPASNKKIEARIRYRQDKFLVSMSGSSINFSSPQSAASGQSIVFYQSETCLGGAIIK